MGWEGKLPLSGVARFSGPIPIPGVFGVIGERELDPFLSMPCGRRGRGFVVM